MFTPKQLHEIEFTRARFGGYDMASVDDVLESLILDYETI